MFKFLTHEKSTRVFALLSIAAGIAATALRCMTLGKNSSSPSWFFIATMVFMLAELVFLFNYEKVEYKELLKTLIASILTIQIVYYFSIIRGLYTNLVDKLPMLTYLKLIIRFDAIIQAIIFLLIFINHFVINYNNNGTKLIVVSQYLTILFYICVIVVIIAQRTMPPATIAAYIYRALLLTTIVAYESKVNMIRTTRTEVAKAEEKAAKKAEKDEKRVTKIDTKKVSKTNVKKVTKQDTKKTQKKVVKKK